MAIGALAWNLVANHRKFTEGLVISRRELSVSKRVMESTRTPTEKYGDQLDQLRGLLNKNTISVDDYNRAAAQLKAELPQNAAAQKTLTDELSRAQSVTQSLMTVRAARIRPDAKEQHCDRSLDSSSSRRDYYRREASSELASDQPGNAPRSSRQRSDGMTRSLVVRLSRNR